MQAKKQHIRTANGMLICVPYSPQFLLALNNRTNFSSAVHGDSDVGAQNQPMILLGIAYAQSDRHN